jgi:outer membrane protein
MPLPIFPAKSGLLFLVLALSCVAHGQDTGRQAVTLSSVVSDAEKNYPSIHISEEELNASVANIRLARTAYLPRIDGLAQFNRATRNNVFGALLPQATIPSMSGPVIGTNNAGSVWGSAAGVLVNWQPFDFGARHAGVAAANAAREKASAITERTRLEIGTASAEAYLTVLAAKKMKLAAQSAVDNWETLRRSVHALTSAELKPGADESRVEAEKAAALTQLALAEQAIAMSEATLHKFMSSAFDGDPASARLETELPSLPVDATYNSSSHPAMLEQRASVMEKAAQLHATERSWVPQFNLEASGYARGTGAETNGQRLAGANGLAPNVGNYAVGVNVTFPFMEFASLHAKEAVQSASLRSARANEQLTDKNLQEQFTQAQATLTATRAIAQNTPVGRKAAFAALDQATARYKAGLVAIDDVAQGQRLAVQAEMDDALARLNVWRAFLRLQFVRGDLQPFLQEAGR